MRIEFDKTADAAFVYFKEISAGEVARTISLNSSLNVDFDKEGRILGIEIFNVSKNIPNPGLMELKESCTS